MAKLTDKQVLFAKCRRIARDEAHHYFSHEEPAIQNMIRYTVRVNLRTFELMNQRMV